MNPKLCKFLCTLLMATTYGLLFSQETAGGSVFYERTRLLSWEQREKEAVDEFYAGNYPDFLTKWERVETIQNDANGAERSVVLFVSPDYVAVGDNHDYFTIPLTPMASTTIARMLGASLPTPKVVDLVYKASRLKLEPFNYIPRGDRNTTPDLLYEHSKVIQAQAKAAGFQPGVFVAGVKKDVVVSAKLADPARQKHVIIYGWHRLDGKPIQPEYNGHVNWYVDYSHGTRLVNNRVMIDGVEYDYQSVLKDELLHTLLSYDKEPLSRTEY